MPQNIITLFDRIKETSNTTGTGDYTLDGPAAGFSAFSGVYSNNDALAYAATNGVDYEVGSGVFYQSGGFNRLKRFVFRSSNANAAVSWSAGIKEVFVTYPGKYAVYTTSGIGDAQQPDTSGIAFWRGPQALDYDPSLLWDRTNNRLGIQKAAPVYTIDIGGSPHQSLIRASGALIGTSGINFSGGLTYSGGTQFEPFLRNELDTETGTSDVFSHSGVVNQRLLFKQQNAGLVLAGPASGCTPPCSPDYPAFRQLTIQDIPGIGTHINTSGWLKIPIFSSSPSASGTFGGPGVHNSGVVFIDRGNSKMMYSNGVAWTPIVG